ncbi:expressed unknown protein [Seminavis robusta]|uniref:Uncharacterized protein n=1 Tax=Seminavis robusta TaxID=568900 RepID=A0A9N8DN67_9STRA|nr:expressed unknown protein [Seminavis robusta]|eukprot:Sro254_g100100.1 n/a (324) ;mRNA; f:17054-18025
MLTAALLVSVVRRSLPHQEDDESLDMTEVGQREKGERFLQDLSFHNGAYRCGTPEPPKADNDDNLLDTHGDCDTASQPCHAQITMEDDETATATAIQAQVRRYLAQSQYRIHKLERQLVQIQEDKEADLIWTEQWKQRKLRKAQRKYDRREERLEREYQKVKGIVQYLQRDQSLCQKEVGSLQKSNQELQKQNQHLLLAHNRTTMSIERKKHQLGVLEDSQHRLQVTVQVYREMIRQLEEETRIQVDHVTMKQQPKTRHKQGLHYPRRDATITKHRTKHRAKTYSSIVVNSVNEVEEQCFHHRLVQDVYTVTPTTRRTRGRRN